MKKLTPMLALFLAGILCFEAQAGPRIVLPTDAEGTDVRAAAADFLGKVADCDVAGAKALFAGPAEQEQLLEAQFRYAAASEKLRKALADRFGEETANKVPGAAFFRSRAKVQSEMPLMLNGDSACVAAGQNLDTGLDLQRIAGNWKVTHLLIEHHKTNGFLDFYTSAARDFDEARAKLNAGGFDSGASALQDLNQRLANTLTKIAPIHSLPTTRPSARPQPPAAPNAFVDAAAVQAAMGKPIGSEEGKALIAALPATPRLMGLMRWIFVASYESGTTLTFRAADGALQGANFTVADSNGTEKYPGALPSGLSFNDARIDVERKLGRPATSHSGASFPYEADYPRLRLHLTYVRDSGRDPRNPLKSVSLYPPETGVAATRPADKPSPRLTFQLVMPEPKAADPALMRIVDPTDGSGRTVIFVSREIVLDETGISEVSGALAGSDRNHMGFSLTLTPDGARRMAQASAANNGRRIAIMLDGRAIVVPTMNGKMSDRLLIDLNIPAEKGDREDLIGQLDAAINALPTTEPAAGNAIK
ncbi:MAG: hypothetical protein JWP03_3920 [Phycisphaerales bacterium]|nr:hypothetical protein [Phycisphaerales bacterium]